MTASGVHVVLGANGPVGLELIRQLAPMGMPVRGVCRSGRVDVPEGVEAAVADVALGQAWHVPNAETVSTQEVLEMAAMMAEQPLKISAPPGWLLRLVGLFNPVVRELGEMQFQWTRPCLVDHSKFAAAFWDEATSLEEGLFATMEWYGKEA